MIAQHLRHTAKENTTMMGKVDTSDYIMKIKWDTNKFPLSLEFKFVRCTYTTPYIAKKMN